MISLFIQLLPFLLILYFLYRSLRDPIFIMGIPFLMFLRASIFFDKFDLFIIPLRSFESLSRQPGILLLVWLVIFWIVFRIRIENQNTLTIKKEYSGSRYNMLDYSIFGLIFITLIGLGIVLKGYYSAKGVYDEFIILISLFLGYFVIKDSVRNTEIKALDDFLFNIVLVNSFASGLYFIHQGLHISLYSDIKNEYFAEVINGEVITRTFWFMPALWFFSIAYLLVFKKRNSFINIGLIIINILGIYISYTRSFLVIAIILVFSYFLFIGYKKRNFGKSVKGLLLVAIASVAMFFIVSNFMPGSTEFFLNRFKELDGSTPGSSSNNLEYRFYKTNDVIDRMNPEKIMFGYGSITENQLPFVKYMNAAAADMGWAEVVFRWGYLGIMLFSLLYLGAIFKAFYLFMKNDGILSQLGLLIMLIVISQILEGFTSFTIMSPHRFALALWYFGILSAILVAKKNEDVPLNSD